MKLSIAGKKNVPNRHLTVPLTMKLLATKVLMMFIIASAAIGHILQNFVDYLL